MTTHHFYTVPVYAQVGGVMRLNGRKNALYTVRDPAGALVSCTQDGTTRTGQVLSDSSGLISPFTTTDVPLVVIDMGGIQYSVTSSEAGSGGGVSVTDNGDGTITIG